MKSAIVILLLIVVYSLPVSAQSFPSLIVNSGEVKTLPARTFIYSEINIQQGGKLIIEPNSADWSILVSQGNVSINGTIEYKYFKSGSNTYNALTPSGENLTHKFSETSIGGVGGHGGSSACSLQGGGSVYAEGGNGAAGSSSFGGGGGAGGGKRYISTACNRQVTKGNDAIGQNGGLPIPTNFFSPAGGNGGLKGIYVNGGLLYIYCGGIFNGLGGIIDVSGQPGNNGTNGSDNNPPYDIQGGSGGGGGGGGSPGGEGGVVILRIVGNAQFYPEIKVKGGTGGKGGKGGRGFANLSSIPTSFGGDGVDGQDGQNGLGDIRH